MIQKSFILFLFIIGCTISSYAQQQTIKICNDSVEKHPGMLMIIQNPLIREDIKPAVIIEDEPTMPGFRIQVYAGTDRGEAQRLKNVMSANYNIPTYMIYESPYFKVRVGDYRSRIEAQQMFHTLKQQYTGILLVPGNINWPDLKQ